MWRSLVARLLWEQDVVGSNPITPTIFPQKSNMNSKGLHIRLKVVFLLVLVATMGLSAISYSAELGINLYGLSYHLDRRDVTGYRFNERNPGVGATLTIHEKQRSHYYIEAGIMEDSYRRAAKYVTFGYGYRIVKGLSIGVLCGIYDSRSVAESAVLVAAPKVAYRYRDVELHLVHLPEFPGINPYPSFALYATLYVWGQSLD